MIKLFFRWYDHLPSGWNMLVTIVLLVPFVTLGVLMKTHSSFLCGVGVFLYPSVLIFLRLRYPTNIESDPPDPGGEEYLRPPKSGLSLFSCAAVLFW